MSIDTLTRVTTPIFKVMCRVIPKQLMGKSSSFERCSTYINTAYNKTHIVQWQKRWIKYQDGKISQNDVSIFSVVWKRITNLNQTSLTMVFLVFLSPFIASSNNNEFVFLDSLSHTELSFSSLVSKYFSVLSCWQFFFSTSGSMLTSPWQWRFIISLTSRPIQTIK